MKSARFSLVFSIAALILLTVMTSCRHDSPTGPTDTTTTSCCHGRITLAVHDSATNAVLDGGSASLYNGDHLISSKPMSDSGTVWDGLCPGQYHFTISKDHYHATEFALDSMGCNDTRTISRTLAPETTTNSGDSCCGGRITLTVRDSATGTVLTGGSASLYDGHTLISTKEMGQSAVWEHLCPGNYSFSLSHDGYHSTEFALDSLGCNGAREVSHTLSSTTTAHDTCCNGVDELTVTDSSTHHGISNASIILYFNGTQLHSATTDDHGFARFANLCEGNYRMTIDHDGYHEGVIEFYEHCNATHGFATALLPSTHSTGCDTASITVRVQDSVHQDTYVAGATVTVRLAGHNDILATGTTTDGGYFTATGLTSPATYTITFSKDGYNEKSIVMQIGACQNYHETYQLGHH